MIVALLRSATVLALPGADAEEPGLLQAGFELEARSTAAADARRRVRRQLRRWAFPSDLCDTAQLLVSELFTNAVLHTESSTVSCELRAGGTSLRIEVRDEGSTATVPMPGWAAPDDEHGRGLLLVETLSEQWGVERTEHGRGCLVWVELGPAAT